MLRSVLLLAMLLLAGLAEAAAPAPQKPVRVLFVGNSLTYVNNLPAMFVALAKSAGRPVEARMLVRGGHTLSQHLASGVLTPELLTSIDQLVLQERGGDLVCADYSPASTESCERSRNAYGQLAKLARAAGATPILLGTYQTQEDASERMQESEAELARQLGIEAVLVSEDLRMAMSRRPGSDWLAADFHPGEQASMLMAIKLYRTVFGEFPRAADVVVEGEDYDKDAKFTALEVLAEPRSDTTRRFPRKQIVALIADARRTHPPKQAASLR
jgi:hypothetical protein